MEKKTVSMEVSNYEVKELLMRHLDVKQADSVANVIIGHMVQTDKGLGQLFKALIGVFPTAQYTPGNMVWVKKGAMLTWKYDMPATEGLPNFKDDMILCQIKDINVYLGYPYTVCFSAIKTGEKTPSSEQMQIREDYIVERAEEFTDILDALEKRAEDADLPF